MPRIPDHLVDRIKREVPITQLVERAGIELRRVGENLVGRCNRHQDDTPSLIVTADRNLFHCMGACQRGGSVIDWVMWQTDAGFHQGARELAEEFFPDDARQLFGTGGVVPRKRDDLPCALDDDAEGQELTAQVIAYYHEKAKRSAEAQGFLVKRGLDDAEVVDVFKLGFADRTLGMTLRASQRRRLQELGFFRASGHEHFNGSLVVPLLGASGEVLGCYGRKVRDDLRPGTPDHLYLPGPHRGLLNPAAFKAAGDVVLCEAPLDALTFWRWGLRNVTTAYGVEGFSEELFDAFVVHGTERVLIAFDRDEAGDRGAEKVAKKLAGAGVACYRVLFPKGMDVNDVGLKMHPADKTLALFLRSAEWMCGGNGATSISVSPALSPAPSHASHAAAPRNGTKLPLLAALPTVRESEPASEAATSPGEATEEKSAEAAEEESLSTRTPPPPPPPSSPLPSPSPSPRASDPLVSSTDDEAIFLFVDRRYRVRGLKRNTAFGILKLNVLATREDVSFEGTPMAGLHADTFDIYLARARQLFERQAAQELGVKDDVVKRDLASMLRRLEEIQAEAVRKAHEPKVKAITLTEKETAEALDFWKSPDLLSRVVSDMTTCGLVGEPTNKLVCYIAAVSRLLERPLAVIVQSSSAAGKTSLMEALLSLMPEEVREKYTAVSGKSLFYFDETTSLRHKILAIVEEEGAERATYPLKLLQSEGELVMASTGKDPHTGKLVTQIYKVEGPVMIILTTTAIELDPELENRCLRLTVDESREQTRLIHELQRKRQTLEGLLARKQKERIQRLHQNAQRLLRPVHVLNPYVNELTFVDDQTRTRRDHDKYLTLIESIALMHQHQRALRRVVVEDEVLECVEVTRGDIEIANRLAGEVLGRTLDELPPQTRRFLGLLHERVRAICEEQGVEQCDLRFTRRDAHLWTGWRSTQVFTHLARLVELEYVLVHRGGRGQSFVYELLYRGEGEGGEPFVLGLVDVEKLRPRSEPGYDPNLSDFSGEVSESIRTGFGGDSAVIRSGESVPAPAPHAALSVIDATEPENARLPEPAKLRSYTLRPFRRGIKLNLLRFPPGSLVARPAARASR